MEAGGGDAVEKAVESEYDTWNPMNVDWTSTQNLVRIDAETPTFSLAFQQKDYKTIQETPCKHYQKNGECPHGKSCRYKHEVIPITDLGHEEVMLTLSLDQKPFFHKYASFLCRVSHVESPALFYIIPEKSCACGCETVMDFGPKNDPNSNTNEQNDSSCEKSLAPASMPSIWKAGHLEAFGEGYEAYLKIRTNLTDTLSHMATYKRRQEINLERSQLVAVRITDHEGTFWYRAEVTDSDVYGSTDRDLPYHELQLLDSGQIIVARADEICSLPVEFCYYPALAYKCALGTIMCSGDEWSEASIECFETLTKGKQLRAFVRDITGALQGDFQTFECEPYELELLIPAQETFEQNPTARAINVAKKLAEQGMAVSFGIFPPKPAALLRKSFGNPFNPFQRLGREIVQKEKDRMEKAMRENADQSTITDEKENTPATSELGGPSDTLFQTVDQITANLKGTLNLN